MTAGQTYKVQPLQTCKPGAEDPESINYKFKNMVTKGAQTVTTAYMVTKEAQTVTTRKTIVQLHMSDLTSGLKSWRTKSQLISRAGTEQEFRA